MEQRGSAVRLPSNALIRQAIDGKVAIPERGVLHAVYENQIYRVAEKKQEKQNQAQPASSGGTTKATPAMDASNDAAAKLLDSLDSQGAKTRATRNEHDAGNDSRRVPNRSGSHRHRFGASAAAAHRAPRCHATGASSTRSSRSLKGPQRAALSADLPPELKETVGALENPQRTVVEELIAQRLTRDIYSNAQLQEVMTDFWLNHFNVFLRKNEATPYYLVSYERDVIRPHALGKFEDLLEATAHSPAMLLYLDNARASGPIRPPPSAPRCDAARNPGSQRKPAKA